MPVSDEKAQFIRGELHAGEDLVWIGEPRSRTCGALPFAALGLVCSLLGPFAPLCLLHIFAVETHVVRGALAFCSAALFETCREGRDRRSDIVERVRFCDIDEVRVVDAKLRALRST